MTLEKRCRAIAGRAARCRCKFRHVSNSTTASCGFAAQHAFLVGLCLQTAVNYRSVKKWQVLERTSQIAFLTQTSNHSQLLPSSLLFIHCQRSLMVTIKRTRKHSCESINLKLISREIIFELFQHVITVPKRYRRTDDILWHHRAASRGKTLLWAEIWVTVEHVVKFDDDRPSERPRD